MTREHVMSLLGVCEYSAVPITVECGVADSPLQIYSHQVLLEAQAGYCGICFKQDLKGVMVDKGMMDTLLPQVQQFFTPKE